ncbi:hypothetical protein D3Z62_07840 [Lachnospiraceae bacterium]|nr:hypothetical protein [Lachnospiraceae bacterium]
MFFSVIHESCPPLYMIFIIFVTNFRQKIDDLLALWRNSYYTKFVFLNKEKKQKVHIYQEI